jgi:hypothetical protein
MRYYPVVITTSDSTVHYDQLTGTKTVPGLDYIQKYLRDTIEKIIVPAVGKKAEVRNRKAGKVKITPEYLKKKRWFAVSMLISGIAEIIIGFLISYLQVFLTRALPVSYACMGLGVFSLIVGLLGIIETNENINEE